MSPPDRAAVVDAERVRQVYSSRTRTYDSLDVAILARRQELERAIARIFRRQFAGRMNSVKLLEVGAGQGTNILTFLKLGLSPANLYANELLPDRLAVLERLLPRDAHLLPGNALDIEPCPAAFDVVCQSLVFSSILDRDVQASIAAKMWSLVAAGGGVLWYDFTYDNPRNHDVRGVSLARVAELFPQAAIEARRVTLAPPLASVVTTLHPALYSVVNCVPLLRTHIVCWLQKPASAAA